MTKSKILVCGIFIAILVAFSACAQSPAAAPQTNSQSDAPISPKTYQDLVVGYAQIGAESDWRVGNTISIQKTAEQLGVELKFSDGQQKQENQINAIRSFIAMKVDVIGISPVVETGWEQVFQEVKDAGIPLILVDRRANVPSDLYISYLGSDFVEEGRNAAREMAKIVNGKANIVELVGTVDSAPANDRYKGFRQVLQAYPGMQIIASESGDFTRAKGKEVMADLLQKYGGHNAAQQINAVFAHNDDMALGAIKAIEDVGLKPGVDIKIVSIDGTRDAFRAMIDGKLNATIECNPLLGPQFYELALKVVNGEPVPKWVPSKESIFLPYNAAQILPSREY